MTKYLLLPAFLISFLLLSSIVNAKLFAANSTGDEKKGFFTNDTVYVYGDQNVTTSSKSIRIYIVGNQDSWTNGTTLSPIKPYSTITTNSTGHIPLTTIWSPDAVAGSYDLVFDINNDGIYNGDADFVANETSVGFQILEKPKPTLTFALGNRTPANHNWNYSNFSQDVMAQIKMTASVEDVVISSFDLIAGGSGDDKNGISSIRIYDDTNANGEVDSGDNLITFGKFSADNGVISALISGGYSIKSGASAQLIITYTITNNVANDNTFNFQLVSASASGTSGQKAIIAGLPLTSSTKTIINAPQSQQQNNAQSSCYSYRNQSSCTNATCSWCASESVCKNASESCAKICRGNLSLSIQQGNLTSIASISGLTDCDDKTVFIEEGNCNNATIVSCNVTGSGCSISFQNLPAGEHKLYACIDINDDRIFDSSEQTVQSILVQQKSEQKTEVVKPAKAFNYLYVIIPIAIILVLAAVYFFVSRKKKDRYEKLKEKWARYSL